MVLYCVNNHVYVYVSRVKHRFALGGGVLRRQHVIRNGSKSSATILGIAIKGENVSAHSQIRVDHDGSDDSYMKQVIEDLKKNTSVCYCFLVGPSIQV